MEEPLVSVLVVTYRQARQVRQCLEGAVMQRTTFPFEVVVGEDCSPDGTRAICQQVAEEHPNLVRLLPPEPRNLGLNANMLRTYRACRGQYIAYLEGDDYWTDPLKLQQQAEVLQRRPEVVLVHTNCSVYHQAEGRMEEHLIRFPGVCTREQQCGTPAIEAEYRGHFRHVKTSTCMYRRAVMDEVLAQDEWAYRNADFPTQDFQLFQDMAYRGLFAFIDKDTTVITHADTLSAAASAEGQWRFRSGFDDIGLYYIDKYHLRTEATQPWMAKEMHWFLHFAWAHPEHAGAVQERMQRCVQHYGYVPARTQRVLLWLLRHPAARRAAGPVVRGYHALRG